ncbi:acyl-CoA dehydrogenase [Paraburkholderia dinghuensis]|uniref:Acyl-CoA dehydrogenase n=1 Tax=Paraburkholderia dinghuensis TaxID=2305225 RepID=A0A3N6N9W9_9BURK|nr:acyl-CoA dehydrogenase family protein [Paraburkholderia dinghuensis]RQH05037.1 acyl-CoA dehydrogenase [Paraburkholderia dinghuensis]
MTSPVTTDENGGMTDEDRELIRDNVRALLSKHWPAEHALTLANDPAEVRSLLRLLGEQGLLDLGSTQSAGGLREALVVLQELGRAACPAAVREAVLTNWLLDSAGADSALASAVHEGQASLAVVFGAGDQSGGLWLSVAGGKLNGEAGGVEGMAAATHLVVLSDDVAGFAIVERDSPGVSHELTPGLAVPSFARVRFDDVPATLIPLPDQARRDVELLSRLCLLARALGAAERGFELAVDHAKQRHQFGQPIGRFQAIQHKLADALTELDGSRLTLAHASEAFDLGVDHWRYFACAAFAYASPALRQVTLETHHVLGAIGYAEEHEAPRHFRRAHADLIRHGGVRSARAELAEALIDAGGVLPEYDLGSTGNAFRAEVRAWLNEHWVKPRAASGAADVVIGAFDPEYARGLGEKGWNALSWPVEFGGQARTPLEQLAFVEETQLAGAPSSRGAIQAHALMQFGSEAQRSEFLPRIASGEVTFCLGYSEPESGSDLASLKTTALRDGDEWVINGQKLWTTGAEYADYMWLAARTDPDAKSKHAGISVFIVPMNTPGITIRPSMAMYGHTFCTEFLDNVRVPASALVGEVNQGWAIITSALATERISMGGFVATVRAAFEKMLAEVRASTRLAGDATVRERIGTLAAEIEVARQLLTRSARLAEAGVQVTFEAGMSKIFSGELMQRVGEAALDIFGSDASLSTGSVGAVAQGRLEHLLRHSIMIVVGGGTNEIQRTLIAQRGLGLPR